MTEYAPKGLIGVLTPQANTTVEAEFQILIPPGFGTLAARMTSDKATMDERLLDYVATLDATVARFANAPLGAVAFACTGASYVVDPKAERQALDDIARRRGYPVWTAADAVAEALSVLGATHVGIVSPYGDALHDAGMRYWRTRGLEVVAIQRLASAEGSFHPIYGLSGDAASQGVAALDPKGLEAILILGTGLPTLATLARMGGRPLPVLTPNLALAWRATLAVTGQSPTRDTLLGWINGSAWKDRFLRHMADR